MIKKKLWKPTIRIDATANLVAQGLEETSGIVLLVQSKRLPTEAWISPWNMEIAPEQF